MNAHFLRFFLIFSKMGVCKDMGFLRCNQCFKMLYLSYKTVL